MNVDKSHKKSPRKARKVGAISKPIEHVSTRQLLDSIKRDIEREIEKAPPEPKPKSK